MIWIILFIVGFLFAWWYSYNKSKKVNPYTIYTFRYYISNSSNVQAMPVKFLENWEISRLDNYLYILYLSLDDNLYMLRYLNNIWNGYYGKEVIVEVYRYTNNLEEERYYKVGRFKVLGAGEVEVIDIGDVDSL